MMYVKIALLGLVRRKGRTFFTTLAVAIAVSMAILLVSVGVGLKQGAAMMYDRDVDYWVIPQDSSVTDLVSNSERTMLGDVHQSVDKISSNPDIKGATPILNRLIYASNTNRTPKAVMGVGVIPGSLDALPASAPGFSPGDIYFKGGERTGEVVINEKTAQLLGLKPGDILQLGASSNSLNNSFRVMGIISAAEYSINPVVVLHLSELQELTGNLKGDRANYIIIRGNNALPFLKGLFPNALVLSSAEYSAYNIVSDKKMLATAVAVSFVSIIIAVLFITSTMILSINEKQKEFAVMRAMGISRRSIMKIVLYESIIISMLGAVFGILLSSLGERVLNMAAYSFFEAGQVAVVTPSLQLAGVGLALVAGILSGLVPAVMTGRVDIVDALG
ncbi:MAG: ABC transporter permease [Candidatus Methanoperedens sp.]|nr:ABC transporter permease [Candidatus Methanoperedens sp.]